MPQNKKITPYQPEKLPLNSLDIGQMLRPVADASAELAKYDTLLSSLPNPDIIILSLLSEEATLSSRIEGTQATFDEVLRHDAGMKDDAKRDDIQEIVNYRDALGEGHEILDKGYKITLALVRELHKTLMSGVRGKKKAPGEFRRVQNWIGNPGTDMDSASFIPPDPGQLPMHMNEWISYLDNTEQEPLIQAALMHAQFELLHPFLDGNGRLGRILIPLFLYQKKRISKPRFYISAYLESNRDAYYQGLRDISARGDWAGWVRFFLGAVAAQAKTNNEKIRKITDLQEEMKGEIQEITHSQFTLNILDTIFANPYSNAADFIEHGTPPPSAYSLIKKLEKHNILTVISSPGGRSKKIYVFRRLVDILINK